MKEKHTEVRVQDTNMKVEDSGTIVPARAMNTYSGRRHIAPHILNFDSRQR
jgi:hypothetical protein